MVIHCQPASLEAVSWLRMQEDDLSPRFILTIVVMGVFLTCMSRSLHMSTCPIFFAHNCRPVLYSLHISTCPVFFAHNCRPVLYYLLIIVDLPCTLCTCRPVLYSLLIIAELSCILCSELSTCPIFFAQNCRPVFWLYSVYRYEFLLNISTFVLLTDVKRQWVTALKDSYLLLFKRQLLLVIYILIYCCVVVF